ncbi:MAG: hypothetical protein ACYC1Q_14350 [Bacteroidia bacterium]
MSTTVITTDNQSSRILKELAERLGAIILIFPNFIYSQITSEKAFI